MNPKEQWYYMLMDMVTEYRTDHPDDRRSDFEIVKDLMEFFAKSGLIRKEDGQYIISELTDDA
ncbi:MAG: hypothetical protein EG826_04330 [Deltaproteobacteria bacterium]|nr:hypothetical protein [Deltaproteobacteria bacterium]